MSKVVKLKRGLDINLVGTPDPKVVDLPLSSHYAVTPSDYEGVVPKLLVREGDPVLAGSPLFFDKNNPAVIFTAPVSGKVSAVNRGEKRKILEVVVEADKNQQYREFETSSDRVKNGDDVVNLLLESGLWPFVIQRPYGVIADWERRPKAVFISGFDSAPLAPDMNFVLKDERENLQAGIDALAKLTEGKVHLSLRDETDGVLNRMKGVEQHFFSGPHPAGNVGVQIHHIDPVNKGELVWTVDVQAVALIGRFFRTGRVDMRKTVALSGSEILENYYVRCISGAPVKNLVAKINIISRSSGDTVRFINGNVLTGSKVDYEKGYLGFYSNMITAIPEGDKYSFLGWALPRTDRFSVSRTYFSWLTPRRMYNLDTNLNGGERPFVVTGLYEKYLPMDIYPMYLLKAILAGDIDKMENLGIYEVVEEDFALCEFVDPSKTEIQQIVRDGINLMIKELS